MMEKHNEEEPELPFDTPPQPTAPEEGEPERAECDFGTQSWKCHQHGANFQNWCRFCNPQD